MLQSEILDVDRFGRTDSFYDFSGTSLDAIRICARIERDSGYRALPVWLLETDILADFAQRLEAERHPAGAACPAALRAAGGLATGDPQMRGRLRRPGSALAPDDVGADGAQMAAWERQTSSGFRLRTISGGHFAVFDHAAHVQSLITDVIQP